MYFTFPIYPEFRVFRALYIVELGCSGWLMEETTNNNNDGRTFWIMCRQCLIKKQQPIGRHNIGLWLCWYRHSQFMLVIYGIKCFSGKDLEHCKEKWNQHIRELKKIYLLNRYMTTHWYINMTLNNDYDCFCQWSTVNQLRKSLKIS